MIDCFIAEDEQILRRGLTLTIDWNALGCRIIGEAENGAQALDLIQKLKPDLIITDIRNSIGRNSSSYRAITTLPMQKKPYGWERPITCANLSMKKN